MRFFDHRLLYSIIFILLKGISLMEIIMTSPLLNPSIHQQLSLLKVRKSLDLETQLIFTEIQLFLLQLRIQSNHHSIQLIQFFIAITNTLSSTRIILIHNLRVIAAIFLIDTSQRENQPYPSLNIKKIPYSNNNWVHFRLSQVRASFGPLLDTFYLFS